MFAPGTDFAYCNGGFCVLALLAERVCGGAASTSSSAQQVIEPAGLTATAYLRSDELPGDAARGYLDDGPRTNVLHLPDRRGWRRRCLHHCRRRARALDGARRGASGDSGDPRRDVAVARVPATASDRLDGYGLGFWRWGDAVVLEGYDAGASFRSAHLPGRASWSVLSNTTEGAWPVAARARRATDGRGRQAGAGTRRRTSGDARL